MLKLYNTLTRQKETFKPRKGKQVGYYNCGPTVYHYVHLGNLRNFVFADTVHRVLKYGGYDVTFVMNITDVGHLTDDANDGEDKMEKGSRREGKTAWDIAAFYTAAVRQDMADLNILTPTVMPKATDHITEQIAQVQTLIDGGYTYETTDGIYFDTSTLDDYGKLARLNKEQLQAGARVDIGEKRNPTDFALWKFSHPGETRQMEWDAPFGAAQGKFRKGFPGWHIECSAMSMKYLGNHFDLHSGGIDHVPVHHTNEIAQAEAILHETPWVPHWLHNEFLLIGTEKMAKSGDNFITLASLKEKGFSPLAYRYFLLQAHYRRQLSFSWEALEAAEQGLKRLRTQIQTLDDSTPTDFHVVHEFESAINDDLNTPEALAVVWHALKEKKMNKEMAIRFDKVLGLNLHLHEQPETKEIPLEVQQLLDLRQTARAQKNWAESDRLRDEIKLLGFTVEDGAEGQRVL